MRQVRNAGRQTNRSVDCDNALFNRVEMINQSVFTINRIAKENQELTNLLAAARVAREPHQQAPDQSVARRSTGFHQGIGPYQQAPDQSVARRSTGFHQGIGPHQQAPDQSVARRSAGFHQGVGPLAVSMPSPAAAETATSQQADTTAPSHETSLACSNIPARRASSAEGANGILAASSHRQQEVALWLGLEEYRRQLVAQQSIAQMQLLTNMMPSSHPQQVQASSQSQPQSIVSAPLSTSVPEPSHNQLEYHGLARAQRMKYLQMHPPSRPR